MPGTMIERILAGGDVRSLLESTEGVRVRQEIGDWIAQSLSMDDLVPDRYARWRPLIRDAFRFLFSQLPADRLAQKLEDQIGLPFGTAPHDRLLRLLAKMPGLQKLGQAVARHQHLSPAVRGALSTLENGISEATPEMIKATILRELGESLERYAVQVDAAILSEASICAVVGFCWQNPETGATERGVFKVIKPDVPTLFAEDLTLLERLSEWLAGKKKYGFATRHIAEMVAEVRRVLERELDFAREQRVLLEAREAYKTAVGVRVPRLIQPLCTSRITAMSEEAGVKVTEALSGTVYQRRMVAEQVITALVAVPLLSWTENALFHTDPHAGNLLYDEKRREVVILDWALTERLSREMRRQITMLVVMTVLRDVGGVTEAIQCLASEGKVLDQARERLICGRVDEFFRQLRADYAPGSLDAMQLLDSIALEGVRFPVSLAMFQKALFTLDGVLHDIAGSKVSISCVLVRSYAIHLLASLGLDRQPLSVSDLLALPKSAIFYPARLREAALSPKKVS